jgi:predicted transcriptional regulator
MSRKHTRDTEKLETITTKVDPELRKKVEEIAEREDRTVSQVARIAIREFLERKATEAA